MPVGESAEQLVGARASVRTAAESGVAVGAAGEEEQAEGEGPAEWTDTRRRGAGVVGRRRQVELRMDGGGWRAAAQRG